MKFPITKKQFREWLASHKPGEIVGEPFSPSCCPLAKATGLAISYKDEDSRSYLLDTGRHVPKWADEFVKNIDVCRTTVTARKALEILDRC